MPQAPSAAAALRGVRVPAYAGAFGAAAVLWLILLLIVGGGRMAGHGAADAVGFAVLWVLMMAAMMLPSIWRVVLLYLGAAAAAGQGALWRRTAGVGTGYVLAWALTALVALPFAWGAEVLAARAPEVATWAGAAVLVAAGAFQFTRFKERCLDHCRSPAAFAAQAVARTGPLRDVRSGAVHGVYCIGCCAGLMAILVVLGAMSMLWMVVVALVVLLEKTWRWGRHAGYAAGVALIVLGSLVPLYPVLLGGGPLSGVSPHGA